MPFIWNDLNWFLVDDDYPYNKNRFVVARKFRVKPVQVNEINGFSAESIRRYFRKYGEIESIEVLPNSDAEAHLTFVSDRSACLLQSQYDLGHRTINRKLPYEVELVFTWEQPSQNVNPTHEDRMEVDDEQTSEMFKLTEVCLLHLFQFLDLDSLANMAFVCKMFSRLLRQHYFPDIRKYTLNTELEPVQVRRTLLCIGHHITELSLQGDGVLMVFLRLLAENVGQNLRRVFLKIPLLANNLQTIAAILQNVETLIIADQFGKGGAVIDYPTLFPNLVELNAGMELRMEGCFKPWPSLRHLSLTNHLELKPEILASIVEQNPQLTQLAFAVYSGSYLTLFTTMSQRLTQLEKLTILFNQFHANFAMRDFNHLGGMPLLSEITLMGLKVNSLKSVIDHLSTFRNLRKIELYADLQPSQIRNYEQSLVNLAAQLPLLNELTLVRIPLKGKTLIDIVRLGHQLQVLHIYHCQLHFTDEFILKLVDELKRHRHGANEALQLNLRDQDLDQMDDDKITEIEDYLLVKSY